MHFPHRQTGRHPGSFFFQDGELVKAYVYFGAVHKIRNNQGLTDLRQLKPTSFPSEVKLTISRVFKNKSNALL